MSLATRSLDQLAIDTIRTLSIDAVHMSADDINRRYEAPDREFAEMNSDCVKSAKELPL